MCGIAGIRRFDKRLVNPADLIAMLEPLAHRGPDDEGTLIRGSVGLGHRRLSIIDIEGSAQPMSSADGRTHVCFNGEILNYRELRSEISYPYSTRGDTELLLAAFDRFGPASVERLRGQFAHAVYAEADDELWLFRDPLGILPLYYYADSTRFVFASEIKALLAVIPEVRVDAASLDAYLARRSVPAPFTLFEGVRKLPPGCGLRVPATPGDLLPFAYWRPSTESAPHLSPEQVPDELEKRLKEAVRRNLVADVPVGAYLSGGVDSSLIVALMRELVGGQNVLTFAASFGDHRFDEAPFARAVSQLLGTEHYEVKVEADAFAELWPRLAWHRDAPVSEASDVAVFRLAELASDRVKVVLSGEGSDELFAGYPKHQFARLTDVVGRVPAALRQPVLRALERQMPPSLARHRVLVRAMSEPHYADRIEGWFAPFTSAERRELIPGEHGRARTPPAERSPDALAEMLLDDIRGWLPDNLLERGDRMSMAASIELRPPFLDVDLVEWALSMPSAVKIRGGIRKWPVRAVARRYLPSTIVDRRKVGFRVPLDEWFRGSLRGLVHDSLLSPHSFTAATFDAKPVRKLIERHDSGRADEGLRIWTLLSLEIWHSVFFGASEARRGTETEARAVA